MVRVDAGCWAGCVAPIGMAPEGMATLCAEEDGVRWRVTVDAECCAPGVAAPETAPVGMACICAREDPVW